MFTEFFRRLRFVNRPDRTMTRRPDGRTLYVNQQHWDNPTLTVRIGEVSRDMKSRRTHRSR